MSKELEKKQLNEYEQYTIPNVDTYETDENYILKADMPGVNKDNLEIMIEENLMTLLGSTSLSKEEVVYQEFEPYSYKRSFRIGNNIDRDKIKGHIDNGVLTVTLPKAEKAKARKIEITSD